MPDPRHAPPSTTTTRAPGRTAGLRALGVLVAVVVLAGVACGTSSESADGVLAHPVVHLADEAATDIASVADGRPLVVNLWASWCVPCLDEMPAFDDVHRERGDEVAIVGVTDDDLDAARTMAERTGATYPLLIDADRTIARELGAAGLPLTVFVSPDGEVLGRHQGALDAAGLHAQIDRYWGAT